MRLFSLLVLVLISINSIVLLAQSELNIYFTGGIHGFIQAEDPSSHGDLHRIRATLDSCHHALDSLQSNSLILDTGDALAYHYLSRIDSGRTILGLMSKIGYDAIVPGNLDFRYGATNLVGLEDTFVDNGLVLANVTSDKDAPLLASYRIVERAGLRVGIVGVINQDLEGTILPEHRMNLAFKPMKETLKPLVHELRNKTDLIILLVHANFHETFELAYGVKGIDVAIASPSHSPTRFVQAHSQPDRLTTLVVNSEANAKRIGHLKLDVTRNGNDVTISDAQLQQISLTEAPLPAEGDETIKAQMESAYRDLVSHRYGLANPDSVLIPLGNATKLDYIDFTLYTMLKSTHSELAVLNDGAFRLSKKRLKQPGLSVRDLDWVNWTDDHLVTLRLTGADILSLMAHAYAAEQGRVANSLHFLAIQNHGAESGTTTSIHGQAIEPGQIYAVVTTRFLADGGDGHAEFENGTHRRDYFSGSTRLKGTFDAGGRKATLTRLLTDYLSSNNRPDTLANIASWLNDQDALQSALWTINLDKLDLAVAQSHVYNNESFNGVSDARVNSAANDLFDAYANIDFNLTRSTQSLRWNNALRLNNQRTKIGSLPLEETADDLEVESTVDAYDLSRAVGLPDEVNIFGSARLDTEISPVESEGVAGERQQDYYLLGGFSYLGSRLSELRLACFGKYDAVDEQMDSGLELAIDFSLPIAGLDFGSSARGRYVFSGAAAEFGDEQASLEVTSYLEIEITNNLAIKPETELFVYRDKVLKDQASYLQYRVGLSYSRFWKPQYIKFWRKDER